MKTDIIKNTLLFLVIFNLLLSGNAYGQHAFEKTQNYEIPFGLIIGSFFLDKTVQKLALKNQSSFNNKLFKIDRYYGDKIITSASLLGLYGFSYLINNEKMKSISEKAILSATVTAISVVGPI